ncbi:MAG TPA: 50S ribosomal protein L18 [Patescibacteria group bacterium]|nr:50S ribosomal protein L18 [Patescibacteria group bacterium]
MLKRIAKKLKRFDRKRRIRAILIGTARRPRLSVFRSLKYISVQAIDDVSQTTLAQANLTEIKNAKHTVKGAEAVGKTMAERLTKLHIQEIVFDRSGYKYHGKVKALAEALRANGITF